MRAARRAGSELASTVTASTIGITSASANGPGVPTMSAPFARAHRGHQRSEDQDPGGDPGDHRDQPERGPARVDDREHAARRQPEGLEDAEVPRPLPGHEQEHREQVHEADGDQQRARAEDDRADVLTLLAHLGADELGVHRVVGAAHEVALDGGTVRTGRQGGDDVALGELGARQRGAAEDHDLAVVVGLDVAPDERDREALPADDELEPVADLHAQRVVEPAAGDRLARAGEHATVGNGVGKALEAVADGARVHLAATRRRRLEAGDRRGALDAAVGAHELQRLVALERAGLDADVPRLGAQRRVVDHAVEGRLHREPGDDRDHHHHQRADREQRTRAARERVFDPEPRGGGQAQRRRDTRGARGAAGQRRAAQRERRDGVQPARAQRRQRREERDGGDDQRERQRQRARLERARRGRGEQVRHGLEQQRGDRRPGHQAEQAGGERERRVLADEQRDDAARRQPDRLQQADLTPLGEHAATDHGRDGEADGDEREQRVDADDDRVRARLVGDRVAHVVPVGERQAGVRERALGGEAERGRRLGVVEPHAEPRAHGAERADVLGGRPHLARPPARERRLLRRHGEAGDAQVDRAVLAADGQRGADAQARLAREAALHERLAAGGGEPAFGQARPVDRAGQRLDADIDGLAGERGRGVRQRARLGRLYAGQACELVEIVGRRRRRRRRASRWWRAGRRRTGRRGPSASPV